MTGHTSSLATVPTVPMRPLYLGGPSDLDCSCSRTLAVSSGIVRASAWRHSVGQDLFARAGQQQGAAPAVHAAMAEAAKLLYSGRGLALLGAGVMLARASLWALQPDAL